MAGPNHQSQQMDTDSFFTSAPLKHCMPQHTPDQQAPQPTHQQGLQGGVAAPEETWMDFSWLENFQGLHMYQAEAQPQQEDLYAMHVSPWEPMARQESVQALHVSPGEQEPQHESQGVPQVTEGVLQGLVGVLQGVPQVLRGVPQVPHGVSQGQQESRSVPHFPEVFPDMPQVPQGAPREGQGESQGCQQAPTWQEGSPVRGEGAVGVRRARRASRPRRDKLYERTEPFEDPQKEKRRRDAINSKKNREAGKARMADLRRRVDTAAAMRDNLRREVLTLRRREAQLLAQLQVQQPAAPISPLTTPLAASPHGQGQDQPLAATPPQATTSLPTTTAALASLPTTTAALASLPTTTAVAALPCPSPHLSLATPYLPPTPPSSCLQLDAPFLTPTSSHCPCPNPYTPPTPPLVP